MIERYHMSQRTQLIANLGVELQRYQRAVHAYDDAVGRALGLGSAEVRCLDRLAEGPATAGELAASTGLRPAATTALIDRLAARGWVERSADEGDRRKVLVRFTAEGSRTTYAYYAPLVATAGMVFDGVDDAVLASMGVVLERMRTVTNRLRDEIPGIVPR